MNDDLKYFLDVALQGSAYWAEFKTPEYDADRNLISVHVRDGGFENDRVKTSWMKIDAKKILKGRQMLVDGNVKVARSHAAAFVGTVHEWGYDIFDADCLIQAVYFGEIVYG